MAVVLSVAALVLSGGLIGLDCWFWRRVRKAIEERQ